MFLDAQGLLYHMKPQFMAFIGTHSLFVANIGGGGGRHEFHMSALASSTSRRPG